MSLGETAQLAVNLSLGGNFASGMASNEAALSRFHGSVGKSSGAMAGFGGAMNHAKGVAGGLIGSLGQLAGVGGVLGVGMVMKDAIGNAKDFAASMEMLRTQAGASQAEVDSMTKAVLALGTSVGTTPAELAKGLYHIESAGIRGAQALDVLTIAAEGAKVGNADLESVTNALVASVNSGISGTKTMGESMGVLNAIVGNGNMRMQDLTDAFSTGILSSAKAFGISIQSVGAAIADMTNQGVPAIDAATRLRMTISLLGAPSVTAQKQLKLIGLSSSDLATAMRGPDGILGAVTLLKTKLDASGMSATEQAQLISHAFGGGRSSSAILTLLGSVDKFRVIQDQVIKGTGAFEDAWAATKKEADFAFQQFGAAFQKLEIQIGTKVLPTITEGLGKLTDFISQNSDAIASGIGNAVEFASKAGAVIGTVIGQLAGAWETIPKPLRDLLVTGFIADKTVKFLFGFDPAAAIGKGIFGALGGTLFSRGSSPANPMFVTGIGGGGIGGGGIGGGGIGGAAGGKLGKLGALATVALGVAAVVETQQSISSASSAQAKGIHETLNQSLASGPSTADLLTKLGAIDTGIREITANPLLVLVQGSALDELRAMRSDVAAQLAGTGAGKRADDVARPADDQADAQREANRIARQVSSVGYARVDTDNRAMDAPTRAIQASQAAIVSAIERLAGALHISISVSDIAAARDRAATTRPPTVLVRAGAPSMAS